MPRDLDGRSLLPLLKDTDAAWEGAAYSQVLRVGNPSLTYMKKGERVMGRSIRVDRYRYTEWDEGAKGGELYDYEADPNEFNNLYDNPKYKALQAELRAKLHAKYE